MVSSAWEVGEKSGSLGIQGVPCLTSAPGSMAQGHLFVPNPQAPLGLQ